MTEQLEGKLSQRTMTQFQIGAIKRSAEVGRLIQQELPWIADEYRAKDMTAPKLVEKYDLARRYDLKPKIAAYAVRYAIRGYQGDLIQSYEGLITDGEELARLASEHDSESAKELHMERRGIHAQTREQRQVSGRKGGLILGPMSYEQKFGLFGMSREKLLEVARRAAPLGGKAGGRAGTLAKGFTPFIEATADRASEIEYAYHLSQQEEYQGPPQVDMRKLADAANQLLHPEVQFTRKAIKSALSWYVQNRERLGIKSGFEQLYRISRTPEYQLPGRVKMTAIAAKVNEEYHEGKRIRTGLTIKDALTRYRRTHAEGLEAALRTASATAFATPLSSGEGSILSADTDGK